MRQTTLRQPNQTQFATTPFSRLVDLGRQYAQLLAVPRPAHEQRVFLGWLNEIDREIRLRNHRSAVTS